MEDEHNYFVGNSKVLVHNGCGQLTGWIHQSVFKQLSSTPKLKQAFINALAKGRVVRFEGVSGIKELAGAGYKGYMYEIKITGQLGKYRLYGNMEKVPLKGGKEIETIIFRLLEPK